MIHKAMLTGETQAASELQAPKPRHERGSLKNKLEASVKQGFNAKTTILKDELATTAGLAASVGGAALIAKSPTAQNAISKGVNALKGSKLGTKVGELASKAMASPAGQGVKKYASKAWGWLKALPKPAKAVLGIGVAATTLISNKIRSKGIYKAGQIDQEYKDKAKIQNAL